MFFIIFLTAAVLCIFLPWQLALVAGGFALGWACSCVLFYTVAILHTLEKEGKL
jgi:hypothetical protein